MNEASVVQVVVGVVLNECNHVLIARRQSGQHLAGFWEFPGGKVEPSEAFDKALCRELHEEVGIQVTSSCFLFDLCYSYPKKDVNLLIYRVLSFSGEVLGCEGQQVKWVAIENLSDYTFPPANLPILEYLRSTSID